MKGFVKNIEDISVKNKNFREVLYTANHTQLVVMSEEIGWKNTKLDCFFG
jgi:hypothetical protein